MKNLYITSILICFALVAGCQKEKYNAESAEEQTSSVVITMNIYNNTATNRSEARLSGVLGRAEYIIDDLRVYVFASDGSLDKMETYNNLNADHLIGEVIEVPKDANKELYFIANEPAAISDELDAITSAEELEQLDFVIAGAMNAGFNGAATFSETDFLTPMTARYSVENAKANINIYVGLSRAVARVDLYLKKAESAASRSVELDSSTTLSSCGVSDDSKLFVGDVVAKSNLHNISVASSPITLSANSYQRALSFYTTGRTYSYTDPNSKIKISVDGLLEGGVTQTPKSVTLGDDGSLTAINRNHVYRIYGSYNGSEIVAEEFTAMDWEDQEIDAEIEGVMVAVDSEVALDWLRNGNTYASKSISFGSNKPISFYLPVEVNNEGDPTPDFEFKLFEFEDMSAGRSYSLKDIALAKNYIFATKWIDSAVIHFTSPQSGYIEFTYTPVKVNYRIQSYPIRIKSDNVVKQLKAVYDNGYLPANMLSDDWAKRAPGGVVLAKRGEANHPLSTPKILYRDDDGYYRGEHRVTAEEGKRYCEDTFGYGWYMPSYADMREIASMFDMLGVSYRFQNNGSAEDSGELTESMYWTSSASSQNEGEYWSADFMSRDYIMDDLMELRDGSQSHFVRCVMDLQ